MGGARSATGDAARTEAVAHRDERIASGSRAIACNGPRSAQHGRGSFGSLNRIMESRDQWRREAEHLRALIAEVPPWSLFWWRCLEAFKTWRRPTDQGLHCA